MLQADAKGIYGGAIRYIVFVRANRVRPYKRILNVNL